MKIFFQPQPGRWPKRGGVSEHLRQLYSFLSTQVEFVGSPNAADILHVETSTPIPKTKNRKPIVFVCHGGFIPEPQE